MLIRDVVAEGGTTRQGTATAESVGSAASDASPQREVGDSKVARQQAAWLLRHAEQERDAWKETALKYTVRMEIAEARSRDWRDIADVYLSQRNAAEQRVAVLEETLRLIALKATVAA